ncbi:MAG: hypothetical protein KA149_04080 [Chitinophagales bacterium]|nr:hypothetical protein [Chitinophagales bacterium]
MKKILLAAMICVGLLLPAINNTSSANHIVKRLVTSISGWVYSATSNAEEGNINRIEIYRIPSGEFARAQECGGESNTCSIDLQGLPHGSYTARIYCANTIVSKQFKL